MCMSCVACSGVVVALMPWSNYMNTSLNKIEINNIIDINNINNTNDKNNILANNISFKLYIFIYKSINI